MTKVTSKALQTVGKERLKRCTETIAENWQGRDPVVRAGHGRRGLE